MNQTTSSLSGPAATFTFGRCGECRARITYGGMSAALSTIKNRIRISDDARYLTAGQIRERFGVPDMWIYRYIKHHGFPRPIRFGGPTSARHWLRSDIEEWVGCDPTLRNGSATV